MKCLVLFLVLLVTSQAARVQIAVRERIDKGEQCNHCAYCCRKGLTCVGNEGNKRCFPLREGGGKCGMDPFWQCIPSLECRNNICIDPKGVKEQCNDPGVVCKAGLVCVGNVGNKRCFPPRLEGDKCGKDPFWSCYGNLVCNKLGMCVKPKGKKGSCNEEYEACKDGLVCVGNEGNKRCFPPRVEGDKCGKDPFWNCVSGLTCDKKTGMCVKGKVKGMSCNLPTDVCGDGLACKGNKGNRRCFPPRLLGDKCGKDPFWYCDQGYCRGGICKK